MERNVVLLILFNKEKKILLQHRALHMERLPDYWGFFGGGIEKGETPIEALRREIKEELRYNVKNPKLLLEQEFKYHDYWGVKYVYVEEHDENQELKPDEESQEMGWFDIEETGSLKIVDSDLKVLQEIKGKY